MAGHSAAPAKAAGPGLLGRVGRTCYRHRRLTLLAWLLGVAVLVTLWTGFGAAASNTFTGSDPGQALLNQHFPRQSGDTLTLAIRSSAGISSPAVRSRITSALARFERAPHVTSVASPYQGTRPDLPGRAYRIRDCPVRPAIGKDPSSETIALISDATAASVTAGIQPRRRPGGHCRDPRTADPPS